MTLKMGKSCSGKLVNTRKGYAARPPHLSRATVRKGTAGSAGAGTREELGRSLMGKYYNRFSSFRALPNLKDFILFYVY